MDAAVKGIGFFPPAGREFRYQLSEGHSDVLGRTLIGILRQQPHHKDHGHHMPLQGLLDVYPSKT